ncbi:hypothetical protein TARUN_6273 [Trichoderma arundinaceum]|uniref:Uncharacterized protein n=1 Tax=Trichoderma arundinaceum TaxID=490622 RepID=A0A395NIN8_TRIAR|nr:hypothetical protein TARUN_6273 [Trichoderma arundinaceum]
MFPPTNQRPHRATLAENLDTDTLLQVSPSFGGRFRAWEVKADHQGFLGNGSTESSHSGPSAEKTGKMLQESSWNISAFQLMSQSAEALPQDRNRSMKQNRKAVQLLDSENATRYLRMQTQ